MIAKFESRVQEVFQHAECEDLSNPCFLHLDGKALDLSSRKSLATIKLANRIKHSFKGLNPGERYWITTYHMLPQFTYPNGSVRSAGAFKVRSIGKIVDAPLFEQMTPIFKSIMSVYEYDPIVAFGMDVERIAKNKRNKTKKKLIHVTFIVR